MSEGPVSRYRYETNLVVVRPDCRGRNQTTRLPCTLARHSPPISRCGQPADILHEETCSYMQHSSRHDRIRDILAKYFRKAPSNSVVLEPMSREGQRRNDIQVTGPGAKGRRNIEYDIKVTSPRSHDANREKRLDTQCPTEKETINSGATVARNGLE